MSTDNKDWNIINDGAYGQVFEKKDGSVIITATWDGKGFKYTSHYPPPKTDTVVEDKGLRTGIMSQMDMYQMGYKDGTKYGNPDNKPYTGKVFKANEDGTFQAPAYFADMPFCKKSDTGKDSKVDWEILALRDADGKLWYSDMPPSKDQTIDTVMRKSDNTVFSVGDVVVHKNNVLNKNGVIESLRIIGGDSLFVKTNNYDVPLSYVNLSSPKPTPEKTVTDNSDVACLSLNDVKEFVGKYESDYCLEQLQQKVNQKLKTHTP